MRAHPPLPADTISDLQFESHTRSYYDGGVPGFSRLPFVEEDLVFADGGPSVAGGDQEAPQLYMVEVGEKKPCRGRFQFFLFFFVNFTAVVGSCHRFIGDPTLGLSSI